MYRKTQNSFFSTGDFCRTPAALDLFSHHPTSTAPSPDRGKNGFMDEIGGYITDGFVSCTETLGCESSDERISGDGLVEDKGETAIGNHSMIWERTRRRSEERKRVVELPPPLTSFDKNGRRDFILRPVRKDGRLQLTEVKIFRPEIMYATREDGRLTLRLVEEEEDHDEEVEEKTEEAGAYLSEEDGVNMKVEEEKEREDSVVNGGDCWSPTSGGEGGEALRRCYEYELAGQQHLNVWSPRFVTTM